MRRFLLIFAMTALAVDYSAAPALADWYPGDGHKMHFPQLPDPNGWDLEIVSWSHETADDWQCSQTGPVSDIHFWTSWEDDMVGTIQWIGVNIYENIPDPDPGNPTTYSQPGDLLWSNVFEQDEFSVVSPYGYGDQGFYSPLDGSWQEHDHQEYQQINIENIDDVLDPFVQQQDEIYWLGLWASWEGTQHPVGWKTSLDYFEDRAVWWDYQAVPPMWHPLNDPVYGTRLDMAFVITPEPAALSLLVLGGLLVIRRRR